MNRKLSLFALCTVSLGICVSLSGSSSSGSFASSGNSLWSSNLPSQSTLYKALALGTTGYLAYRYWKGQQPARKDQDIVWLLELVQRRKQEKQKKVLIDKSYARLEGLSAEGGDFHDAILPYANLRGAKLRYAGFAGADLSGANLTGADLSQDPAGSGHNRSGNEGFMTARLRKTDFTDADLSNANFYAAGASGAIFTNATLINTNFMAANLSGANFNGADLRDAKFYGANVTGANFSGADISGAQFDQAMVIGSPESKNPESKIKGLTPAQIASTKSWSLQIR